MTKLVVIESCNECKYLYPKINKCQLAEKKVRDVSSIPIWCPLPESQDRVSRLKADMNRLEISYSAASDFLGISKAHLINILNRKHSLSLSKIILLKKMFAEKEKNNANT